MKTGHGDEILLSDGKLIYPAKSIGICFYVAAPSTTVDLACEGW